MGSWPAPIGIEYRIDLLTCLALLLVFGSTDSGEVSKTAFYLSKLMSWSIGVIIVGVAALITMEAGVYYLHKAWTQS